MAERQFRPTLPDLDIGGAAVPRRWRSGSSALPIWIVVGRRCPAAGGAAAPPYRGFGLLNEWRSGSSALPIWIVVGRRCPAASGAAAPPYRIWIVVG